jgi:RNA polymerase I-specific transcription initiation factor RRN7
MRLHLTKHKIQALSPHVRRSPWCEFLWSSLTNVIRTQFPPKAKLLHALSSRLAKRIFVNYRTPMPEANAASILWRAVKALAGSGMSQRIFRETRIYQ